MCNLTTVRKSAAEVARHFRVRTPPDVALNVPGETLPGYPGMVIREARQRWETRDPDLPIFL
jgi:hypothetical protein